MLTLMQLIKLMPAQLEALKEWCDLIAIESNEGFEFAICLENEGIELTDYQINSLIRVCQNGSYKSAFALSA